MARPVLCRLTFWRCLVKNRNARYFAEFEDSTAAFVSSQERLKTLEKEPNDKTKLELYALYKQATIGLCNSPKPGTFDFVAKAKRDAWLSLGDMTKRDAETEYVKLVDRLAGGTSASDN